MVVVVAAVVAVSVIGVWGRQVALEIFSEHDKVDQLVRRRPHAHAPHPARPLAAPYPTPPYPTPPYPTPVRQLVRVQPSTPPPVSFGTAAPQRTRRARRTQPGPTRTGPARFGTIGPRGAAYSSARASALTSQSAAAAAGGGGAGLGDGEPQAGHEMVRSTPRPAPVCARARGSPPPAHL